MPIYRPQSKNIVTLFWSTSLALIGVALMVILNLTNHPLSAGPASTAPVLGALYPLLYAGVPVLLLASFIFAIFTVSREDSRLGRGQAVVLMLIILILAYIASYSLFANGGM